MLRNAAMGGGKALTMQTNPCWFELAGRRWVEAGVVKACGAMS